MELGDNDDLDLLMDVDEVLDTYQEEIEDEEFEEEDFEEKIGEYDLENEY